MKNSVNVRRIIFETAKKKAALSVGIVCAVGAAIVASLFPPLILGKIIDRLTAGKGISFAMALSYFALLALASIMESARESGLILFGQKITHALRSALMGKMVRLNADCLNAQEPGSVVSRFVGDVDTVEQLFTNGIVSMFADACRIIGIVAVIWFRNRGLALLLAALIPFLFAFTRHVQKRMLAAQIENRRAVSRASGSVPETLSNIRTIHALGKETHMEQKYDEYIEQGYRATEKTNFYDAIYSPVILIVNAVVVAAVMLLSASGDAHVIELFGMSAGTAVAVMNYIAQIFAPIESLGIDGHNVLNHLSFQVQNGEQATLSGRTGAGKSTIFKLLMGLYEPQQGEVCIEGVPASAIPDEARRGLFGYVEQTFHRVPGTVRDQITLFDASIADGAVQNAAKLAGLDETIRALPNGYDTPCTPELFSQGQWQLLSIARAAAANPKLLLLDEITANLDVETENQVLEALKCVSVDRTVISISHRTNARTGRVIPISAQ